MPDKSGHAITVYKYGVIGDLPEPVIEEIRRAHRLRNELVEIEYAYADRLEEIYLARPEVAAAHKALKAAEARAEELTGQVNQARRRDRAAAAELAAQAREARIARRDARAELNRAKEAAYPTVKPEVLAARAARDAAFKGTYRTATDDGLYHATISDLQTAHMRSVAAVTARRKAGRHARLRLTEWDGTGTIRVQLRRQNGFPVRSPHVLANGGGKWANVAQLSPWIPPAEWDALPLSQRRRIARTGRLRFRIGAHAHAEITEIGVALHRPLPPEADVAEVRITRSRIAGTYRASVTVTARMPRPRPRVSGPAAAVHLGWRSLPDGALRVAVIGGAGPVPEGLAEFARYHGPYSEVVFPADWRNRMGAYDRMRSRRALATGHMRDWLVEWLERNPGQREVLAADGVETWWTDRLAALALAHRDDPPPGAREAIERLNAWRVQDRHLWEGMGHGRQRLLGRRRDAYKRVAAWVSDAAALVVLDEWGPGGIVHRTRRADLDDHRDRLARANAFLAAPGELRTFIERAAARRGVQTQGGAPPRGRAPGPRPHAACGTAGEGPHREVMVWCAACQVAYDQDVNAAQMMLAGIRGQ